MDYKILWADDEIELLKPHVIFLEQKGYNVVPVNSGVEALEEVENQDFDVVFLDESMPGLTGLEVLSKIKVSHPNLPVVMITKNEEEYIMEEAIGAKIADYLIKPINPNQVLLSLKKILDSKRLTSQKTNSNYQQDFQKLSMTYNDIINYEEWSDVYKKMVHWEVEIDQTENQSMRQVLEMQKGEANKNFSKFISNNYQDWLNEDEFDKPLMSHELMEERVFPCLDEEESIFFLLIDNLRLDQWKVLAKELSPYFKVEIEDTYYSLLPTTTAYSRNSIFSGLTPLQMSKKYPELWKYDDEKGGKNNHEKDFFEKLIQRNKLDIKWSYNKVLNMDFGKSLVNSFNNLLNNKLNLIVYNFVDMLSHARTDMEVIKELASDESAYRALTKTWFEHSPLNELLKKIANSGSKLIITTDHGTIRVKKPHKIVGDKNTNSNLRYKQGKNLNTSEKEVFVIQDPEKFQLPKRNVSTSYVFAQEELFFAYPNNYNHYVKYYDDTFQHGGVSLEEVIIPFIELRGKK